MTIAGGSGDADLYLRAGAQPEIGAYDCRPYLWGNNEACTIANPTPGTWHIGVHAYTSDAGVNVHGTW